MIMSKIIDPKLQAILDMQDDVLDDKKVIKENIGNMNNDYMGYLLGDYDATSEPDGGYVEYNDMEVEDYYLD